MWPTTTLRYKNTMKPTALPVARPWTPPEMDQKIESPPTPPLWLPDDDEQSDSGYFGAAVHDNFHEDSDDEDDLDDSLIFSRDINELLSLSASASPKLPSTPLEKSPSPPRRSDAPHQRPKADVHGLGIEQRPYTPKTPNQSNAPQFPYTPDSARMPVQRAHTYQHDAPLSPMPWTSPPTLRRAHASPIQNALFSTLNNLEHIIHTNQPNDAQMEYIVTQFEAMTSYLLAPESQSKNSDEHLFSEVETTAVGNSTSTASKVEDTTVDNSTSSVSKAEAGAYVFEVGRYIKGIKKHAEGLKTRLEEVKELNSIHLDIITDLRREAREREMELQALRQQQPREKPLESPAQQLPQNNGFWASVGVALDAVGEMLHE